MTQTILNQLREEAKQSFKELDYPSLNYGSGIRLEQDFKDITESEESSLKILAPSEVKVLNIKDTNIAEKYLAKLIKVNQNKFTALHYKLLNNVKFIIIPENATLNDTICIESISNSNLSEHLVVIAKANSKANIIIKKKNSSPFASQFIEAYTEANAELSFYNIGKHKEDTINIVYHKGEAL